jgi:hypothetical protein
MIHSVWNLFGATVHSKNNKTRVGKLCLNTRSKMVATVAGAWRQIWARSSVCERDLPSGCIAATMWPFFSSWLIILQEKMAPCADSVRNRRCVTWCKQFRDLDSARRTLRKQYNRIYWEQASMCCCPRHVLHCPKSRCISANQS